VSRPGDAARGPQATRGPEAGRGAASRAAEAPATAHRWGAFGRIVRTTAFKLSLVYLVVFTAAALFLLVYIATSTTDLLSRQLEETIDAEIKGLAEQYKSGGLNRLVRAVDARSRAPGASLYLLTDFAGNRIAGNVADAPAGLLDAADGDAQPVPYQRLQSDVAEEPRAKTHEALVRIHILPGGFRLLVGRDLAEREQFRAILRQAFQVSVGVVILLALGTWVFVTRRVLKRIDAVSETTKRIVAGDLSGRIAVDGSGDEFDRLAISVNAMLDRIEQLMHGLKEVSDNIAHDLKTPLTRLRTRLEVALAGPPTLIAYREALEATVEDSEGLIRTFEALLRIARVEAGSTGVALAPLDAAAIAREVGELYEPVAEEEGATMTVDAPGSAPVMGDRNLIAQALANLVDNALKYGHRPDAPARVRLSVRRVAEAVEIAVADAGPGVPEADRERVLGRFVRLEQSRNAPGSGLGLSLVQAVASLHKGSLTLGDAGPGLVVTLTIPAAERGEG